MSDATATIDIRPHTRWPRLNVGELWAYGDLITFFVWRGIRARYAQTALGCSWAVIQPLFSSTIFTVVFGMLAEIPSAGAPYLVFSLAATAPWTFFSNSLTDASESLIKNANTISKVYFPRAVLPIAAILSKSIDFAIAFVTLLIAAAVYGYYPGVSLLLLPLLLLILLATSLGIGLWLSSLAIQFRDVQHSLPFLVQAMLYMAPVVYPTSIVPAQFRLAFALNPMVGVIEGFRAIILHQPIPWDLIATGAPVAALLLVSGLTFFRTREQIFADVA